MTKEIAFQPNWASAPGETISDILIERRMPVAALAERMELTLEEAQELLEGRATVTIATARRLEQVLGGSVQFWIARDLQYRQDVTRLHVDETEWLRQVPVGDMVKFGWIDRTPHPKDEVRVSLRFFGVPDVATWQRTYAGLRRAAAFRSSSAFDTNPASLAAWLRQGEIEGRRIVTGKWNLEQFQHSLSGLRALTRWRDPNRFLPELRNRCAESGVAVVIVRSPQGCRASGAVRFLSPTKALVQLTFRFLSDDQFWFTFFHEAGHLVLHHHQIAMLESTRGDDLGLIDGADALSKHEESEANDFAERVLIPPEIEPLLSSISSRRDVIRLAVRAGISPGLLVGQLQHHERLGRDQFNDLKRRYRWS